MLGKTIRDADNVESEQKTVPGLGLLDSETVFIKKKTTTQVNGKVISDTGLLAGLRGLEITGYEIHMGQTAKNKHPLLGLENNRSRDGYFDGATSENGLVFGTYLHGLFHNEEFLRRLISNLHKMRGISAVRPTLFNREEQYDRLANLVRQNLDIKKVYQILESE